ncbi:energy-coupling factor ABC transporter substrate-binding protein [Cylindrospermopsis raciborskii]|uniref:Cobalt transport protein CbiN n=1 Tax=Cylindrospermopsis raciborskii CENA302 TaxID=1170768 RepID=A0A9Q5QUZ3_9CYAN|nr:energy-coupling factor ABC transporter substrate-binding protein [Cylindrospermopsis raciborskii]NLQ06041.1 energy-coupling factor ABC transporter substrate-binding protein [Cylindrospermopsis raciborskii MVCC19]OHY32354.1 cobalt ABC transporter substrate-binding protein CbiN [Cylindrospermopsis raciborskii MVCC14]OPH08730.1 cobalt ABC transporter substrate-binding protein CbiN [Cylindrospermopsis raciborskii CENA302]
MNQSQKGLINWLLVVGVVILAVTPLVLIRDSEFGGADQQAQKVITEIQPKYKPWFKSLFEPPSREIESLLFALQAALGAGVVGYGIGLYKGRSQPQNPKNKPAK